jgi:hypothetical protein
MNYFFSIGIFIFSIQVFMAQYISRSSISALGFSSASEGTYLSQTIGQGSLHTSFERENCLLRQGFQQPISGIYETSNTITMSVYPNPTSDNLNIVIKTAKMSSCKVSLYDLHGITICMQDIMSNREQKLTLPSTLAPGTYIIKVSEASHFNWSITDKIFYHP